MKVLLIGGSGLIGKYLLATVPAGNNVLATYQRETERDLKGIRLDITDRFQVTRLVTEHKPDLIIHAASVGNIDFCEYHQEIAWKVNVTGTQNVIEASQTVNAKVIFLSSNAVFTGDNPPYNEDSPYGPLNYYGESKVAAEVIVKKYLPNVILLRLVTMYGWNYPNSRMNPVTWILERMQQKKTTPIVNDVTGNHLWAGQAAETIWKAVINQCYGEIIHIAGKECSTRYAFLCKVADTFGYDQNLLQSVTSNYFSHLAKRATNTCFDVKKMQRLLGMIPLTDLEGLRIMKRFRITGLE
jgi:dTDP-4-dehydrorhamnose reductase